MNKRLICILLELISLVILQVFNNSNNIIIVTLRARELTPRRRLKKNAPLRNAKNERNRKKANDVKT